MQPLREKADRQELIFALVGAAGTDLTAVSKALTSSIARFDYRVSTIKISSLLEKLSDGLNPEDKSEYGRIKRLQEMGNKFRTDLNGGDGGALVRAGISEIRNQRKQLSGHPDKPALAHAYIIHQLKHPDEVELLRRIYGKSFYLIASHAQEQQRITNLSERMARIDDQAGKSNKYASKAIEIVEIDEKQDFYLGQNTRDTYPQADLFLDLNGGVNTSQINRFLDLLFGHPFHTPSPEEFAMHQASAVSLRSSDFNRQVGAVIVSLTRQQDTSRIVNADIIASGANEVPRSGGGFYWDGDSPDQRDQRLLHNEEGERAAQIKISVLTELIEKIEKKNWLKEDLVDRQPKVLARELLGDLKRTQFMDIGEFSRPVHAEMAALIDSARRGVSVNSHTMYVTTFPCHNCAKHIIAAGLQRVVYLEPYPKSRASYLYKEELLLDPIAVNEHEKKLVFKAYSGIAPQQHRQLFSMIERGGAKGRSISQWTADMKTLAPVYAIANAALAYTLAERQALELLPTEKYPWDKLSLCP